MREGWPTIDGYRIQLKQTREGRTGRGRLDGGEERRKVKGTMGHTALLPSSEPCTGSSLGLVPRERWGYFLELTAPRMRRVLASLIFVEMNGLPPRSGWLRRIITR